MEEQTEAPRFRHASANGHVGGSYSSKATGESCFVKLASWIRF